MGGVGEWIARFRHIEHSSETDDASSDDETRAHFVQRCLGQKRQDAPPLSTDNAKTETTAPIASPKVSRRRLKKKALSDSDDDATGQSPTRAPPPEPPLEKCPVVCCLISGSSDDSTVSSPTGVDEDRQLRGLLEEDERAAATTPTSREGEVQGKKADVCQEEEVSSCQSPLSSTALAAADEDPELEAGVEAVTACLELSTSMADHLVSVFGGSNASADEKKAIQQKIGQGRTSLAHSMTSSALQGLLGAESPLKEYQLVGVQWLLALHERNCYGILADEMGLGKTAQTITFLKLLQLQGELDSPCVVTCPATLVDNWMIELRKWAPSLRAMKYHGTQKDRRALVVRLSPSFVLDRRCMQREFEQAIETDTPVNIIVASLQAICNAWDRAMLFKKQNFSYIIVDEAHNLKNSESQLYRYIKKSCADCRRLFLTGSPIQNEVAELQNLLLLLLPETFSGDLLDRAVKAYGAVCRSQEAAAAAAVAPNNHDSVIPCHPQRGTDALFNHTAQGGDITSTKDVEFLRQIFAPFILRRLKSEVMDELPPKVSIVERCTMTGVQAELYMKEIREADSELSRALCFLSQKAASSTDTAGRAAVAAVGDTNTATGTEVIVVEEEEEAAIRSSPQSDANGRSAKKTTKKQIGNKQYIQNLMFRLRRICNHPLLFKGFYTDKDTECIAQFFHTKVEGFREQPYDRVKAEIASWSDFEVHQAICDLATSAGPLLQQLQIPDDELVASAKIRRMLEIVDTVHARRSKALIFSQFTTYLDVIEETLRKHRPGILFFRLDGTTAVSERQTMITEFGNTDSEATLFLLSTKAGGVGLNLTAADTVLLMDQDWNPHNDRQAEDRVHRLGQRRSVTVHRLCCRGTIEESILKCAERKLRLDEAFGGNADLLTAAILKDCFATGLAMTARETATDATPLERRRRQKGQVSPTETATTTITTDDEGRIPRRLTTKGKGGGSKPFPRNQTDSPTHASNGSSSNSPQTGDAASPIARKRADGSIPKKTMRNKKTTVSQDVKSKEEAATKSKVSSSRKFQSSNTPRKRPVQINTLSPLLKRSRAI